MNNKITIAIAEDHDLLRNGIISMLERKKELNVLFDVGNGKELIKKLKIKQPDVILLDIAMPLMDGDRALEKINNEFSNVKVIMLSAYFEPAYIVKYISSGAKGFLPKNCEVEELIMAVKQVYEKGFYYGPEVSDALASELRKKADKPKSSQIHPLLSPAESKVLDLLMENKTNDEIADELSISTRTVEWHRSHILKKTGNKSLLSLISRLFQSKSKA